MTDKVTIGEYTFLLNEYDPAVLPLSAVHLSRPMPVRALKTHGEVKKGEDYYVIAVYRTGEVSLYGMKALHPMDMFVELLARPTGATGSTPKPGK